MAEALNYQQGETIDWTADATYAEGDIVQLNDGRCGWVVNDCVSGDLTAVQVTGVVKVAKTTTMVLLNGGRAYWDHSANKVNYKKVNDRDFYMGRLTADAASADTVCYVALNIDPAYDIDILRDAALSVATGTQAAGGFGLPKVYGGAQSLALTSTNEAQCIDLLSVDRFDKNANAIIEGIFRLGTNGSTSDVDLNFGIANGTSTTDFDATTEHVAFHIDGGTLTILAQSKDGTTTVSATTTGVSATAASAVADRVEFWIDCRDTANVKLYVNSARVISGSTFKIDGATGPFGLIAHLEKVSGTATAGPVYLDALRCRLGQI